MRGRAGVLLGGVLLLACSSDGGEKPGEPPPQPLPADCDVPLPETALMPDIDCSERVCSWNTTVTKGLRMIGSTVYFIGTDGVHAADVPGGVPRLVVPLPEGERPFDEPGRLWPSNFWVDETTITIAHRGVLYRAPREGGEPTQVAETLPFLHHEWDTLGQTVRAGDWIYTASSVDDSLYRMPWAGGERVRLKMLRRPSSIDSLFAGTAALFYRSPDEGETWAFPYDGGEPELVADRHHDILLGAEEQPYLLSYGPIEEILAREQTPWIVNNGTWRDDPPPSGPMLPRGVHVTTDTNHTSASDPLMVRYEDALYFIAEAAFTLPDDLRVQIRPLLMRLSPELDSLEVVRCIPPPSFDPSTPGGGQEDYEIHGIAASAAGIFVERETDVLDVGDGSVRPHAVKVWP